MFRTALPVRAQLVYRVQLEKAMGSIDNILGKVDTLMAKTDRFLEEHLPEEPPIDYEKAVSYTHLTLPTIA